MPQSFVMKRGKLSDLVSDLTDDVRRVMEPHTAVNLKSKTNKLKDFVQVSGPLGISHFLILSATDKSRYFKICRAPRGPTLSFRVHKYTLAREVAAAQKNPRSPPNAFRAPPLVVLNNFGDAPHQKLATITFQNLFPPINVKKVKLSTCQRAVLVDFDKESNRFMFGHYSISAAPTGANRALRKAPHDEERADLGNLTDVSEFSEKAAAGAASDASDSEGEDAVAARVDLTQDYNRVAKADTRSRVILQEIGPRMELELVKVEEACAGARPVPRVREQDRGRGCGAGAEEGGRGRPAQEAQGGAGGERAAQGEGEGGESRARGGDGGKEEAQARQEQGGGV